MHASILVVTHALHAPFCAVLLRSLAKYATGFDRILIAVPPAEVATFQAMIAQHPALPLEVRGIFEVPNHGHVGHTVIKTYADVLLPEASMIVHLDADVIATRPFTPQSYLSADGRIIIFTKPYAEAGDARCWQAHAESALGEPTLLETMQKPQLAYWAGTYGETRLIIEFLHHQPFTHFCLGRKCWPEFNALGHVALTRFSLSYQSIAMGSEAEQTFPHFLHQSWSHYVGDPVALATELSKLEATIG